MGSSGMKRRRKPTKPLPKVSDDTPTDGWVWEQKHSPYTFEGQVEGIRRMAINAHPERPRPRTDPIGRLLLYIALGAIAIVIVLVVTGVLGG